MVKIWIDADACPGEVKEIVFRASERLNVPVCLVANREVPLPRSALVTAVRVPEGLDVADNYIVREVAPEDLVITADIPLASEVVAKGAVAIDPRGELYTEDNVGERLSLRNFMQELRAGGLARGGPPQLGAAARRRFAAALDGLLTQRLKGG